MLDREKIVFYNISVIVRDGGNLSFSLLVYVFVFVLDVNDEVLIFSKLRYIVLVNEYV